MNRFDHIAIIFNPGSTGDAPTIAQKLSGDIPKSVLVPTQHAGHAIELAKDVALKYDHPLIISVSGDGGYNEVINGAMQAKQQLKTASPIVAVAAAGNANDHRRVTRDAPLATLIKRGETKSMDLLHFKSAHYTGYAHSYIGLGVTPEVGNELNKHGKGLLSEIKLITKTFFRYKPFVIVKDGSSFTLNNLIFANINEMAKIIQLDDNNDIQDGRFEVILLPHHNKGHMLFTLLKIAIRGYKKPESVSSWSFTLNEPSPVQFDGEIQQIKSGDITVTSVHKAIESVF